MEIGLNNPASVFGENGDYWKLKQDGTLVADGKKDLDLTDFGMGVIKADPTKTNSQNIADMLHITQAEASTMLGSAWNADKQSYNLGAVVNLTPDQKALFDKFVAPKDQYYQDMNNYYEQKYGVVAQTGQPKDQPGYWEGYQTAMTQQFPNTINSRVLDGDSSGVLPQEDPCLMQAFDGNTQSAVGRNLIANQMADLVTRLKSGDDPAISETYYVNDPRRVIQETLRQLGEDPQNYNIQVGSQGGPKMAGATGSVLAVSRQDDKTKVGHYEEGDAMGRFRWDPISGTSQGGRVVFPSLTRWVKIEKLR